MDAKKWYMNEKNLEYYKNKENVSELIKLCGENTSDYKMTYTYVAICDRKNIEKTHVYYIWTPFITGLEKYWEEEEKKPWNRSYSYGSYREHIPYFYIKDDSMSVPEEFYKIVNNGRDVYILKYDNDNYKLDNVEYVYVGVEQMLKSIEYKSELHKEGFKTWYEKKESKANVELKFVCPLKDTLPFKGKDIVLEMKRRNTTFYISREL
jgi:hypothetical protein